VTIPSIFLSISGTSFGTTPISEIPAQARFSSPSRFPQAPLQRPKMSPSLLRDHRKTRLSLLPTSALLCRAQEPTSAQAGGQPNEEAPQHATLPPLAEGAPATKEPGGWGVLTNGALAPSPRGSLPPTSALLRRAQEPTSAQAGGQ
jgi:hypothetical protein